jgi:hypothetical protein
MLLQPLRDRLPRHRSQRRLDGAAAGTRVCPLTARADPAATTADEDRRTVVFKADESAVSEQATNLLTEGGEDLVGERLRHQATRNADLPGGGGIEWLAGRDASKPLGGDGYVSVNTAD